MSFIDAPIGTRMDCFALVKKSEVRTSAKGSQYLDMDLADKDGEINAKFWAYENSATPNFQPNDIVKIRGTINEYRGTRQFRIERIPPTMWPPPSTPARPCTTPSATLPGASRTTTSGSSFWRSTKNTASHC